MDYRKKKVGRKIDLEGRFDYSFSEFRQDGKIGYWRVVVKIFLDFVVGGHLEIKYVIKI